LISAELQAEFTLPLTLALREAEAESAFSHEFRRDDNLTMWYRWHADSTRAIIHSVPFAIDDATV
jgi:hypothetical protein